MSNDEHHGCMRLWSLQQLLGRNLKLNKENQAEKCYSFYLLLYFFTTCNVKATLFYRSRPLRRHGGQRSVRLASLARAGSFQRKRHTRGHRDNQHEDLLSRDTHITHTTHTTHTRREQWQSCDPEIFLHVWNMVPWKGGFVEVLITWLLNWLDERAWIVTSERFS